MRTWRAPRRGGPGNDRTAERTSPGSDALAPRSVADRGITLVEVLVAVVLMGIGVVAVLGALGTSIRGSATYERKIDALATLETASSGLTALVASCDHQTYLDAARAAVPDDETRNRLGIVNVTGCGGPLHQVTLSYQAPDGLIQILVVPVGGPIATDDQGTIPPQPVSICGIVSASVIPNPISLNENGEINIEDAVLRVTTDGECSGDIRVTFSPPARNPAAGLQPWEPAAVRNNANALLYELDLDAFVMIWEAGDVNVTVRQEVSPTVTGGQRSFPGLFTLEAPPCTAAFVAPPSIVPTADGVTTTATTFDLDLAPGCSFGGNEVTPEVLLTHGGGQISLNVVPSAEPGIWNVTIGTGTPLTIGPAAVLVVLDGTEIVSVDVEITDG